MMQPSPVDGAVTVRERGPTGTISLRASRLNGCRFDDNQDVPQKLKHRIPLPHGHGSVRSASDVRASGKQSFFLESSQRFCG